MSKPAHPEDSTRSEADVQLDDKTLGRLSHRGRVLRILVAILLSTAGWLWTVPYAGWAMGLILQAPAAVLFGLVARDSEPPRFIAWCSLPTLLGAGVSAWSLLQVPTMLPWVLSMTLLTTLLALLLGAPRGSSH